MSLYVLDTDVLTLLRRGHPLVSQYVARQSPTDLAVTVLSVEEQLTGWYSLLRWTKKQAQIANAYHELAEAVRFYSRWQILSFPLSAMNRYTQFMALKLNIGAMDLRIAAVVLEHSGTLVTRNTRDFQRVPNLPIVDWSV